MKTLGRKCKCGTLMLVDVEDDGTLEIHVTSYRASKRYNGVECIQGCALSLRIGGVVFDMPVLNKGGVRAVYCRDCYGVRRLNLFSEIKV